MVKLEANVTLVISIKKLFDKTSKNKYKINYNITIQSNCLVENSELVS